MKIVYNNKEISNNTNNYNALLNRPMINSHTLEGVVTLSDINIYTKEQIDELIGNSRSIEIVTALPTNLIENTLYYVGPDANDFYDVYLVDEVRNVLNIGTSQFGEYFAGTGIDIDADNYISTLIDNKTLVVDSENNLHANLDVDMVPIMVGATSSVDGVKGLVPAPGIGAQNSALLGNATWKPIIDILYPVGSVYLTLDNTNPGTFMTGTTWTKLSTGRALWNDSTGGGGTIDSGLPNISGNTGSNVYMRSHQGYNVDDSNGLYYVYKFRYGDWHHSPHPYGKVDINLARSSSVFKDDQSIVQPNAVKICAWRRTA